MTSPAEELLTALTRAVGPGRVVSGRPLLDRLTRNTVGLQRAVVAAAYPRSAAEVQRLVRTAIRHRTPLYAYSRGLNWGYGSRLPPVDGCVLVDLHLMDRIVNAEEIAGGESAALIEPGVTQGQLAEYLRQNAPRLTFNVTGSAPQTSIIGNALERGFGYLGPRSDDLFGVEAVLGTGELVHTDFSEWTSSPLARTQNVSHGPGLTGLFLQSSFGIVTRAHLQLRRRHEVEGALILRAFPSASIGELVARLAALREAQLLHTVPHLANRERAAVSLTLGCVEYFRDRGWPDPLHAGRAALASASFSPWSGVAAFGGPRRVLKASLKEVAHRLKGLAQVHFLTDRTLARGLAVAEAVGRFSSWGQRQAAMLSALRPLHGLTCGRPTDVPVRNLALMAGKANLDAAELDESDVGIIFSSPILPPTRSAVEAVLAIVGEEFARFRLTPYITLNVEKPHTAVAIVNSVFRKSDPAETDRAQSCALSVHRRLQEAGYALYRAGVDTMQDVVGGGRTSWDAIARIKDALDPHHIISPGRYAPLAETRADARRQTRQSAH